MSVLRLQLGLVRRQLTVVSEEVNHRFPVGVLVKPKVVAELALKLGCLDRELEHIQGEQWVVAGFRVAYLEEWFAVDEFSAEIKDETEAVELVVAILKAEEFAEHSQGGIIVNYAVEIHHVV